ncbi:sulfatase [Kiritimatiella glycovorans]|uniref:Arylsulfatase n=1 Tax=Kiritimatiella glycovorans TaxID=1307763 RepID=A0A0G3EDU0_9BACT|nr:sulfatase-like hydrolase/transferase [Kiritimatiella glycovorans]AKJ64621.1 Arylsulfatase precursor [Kiritimatiella glycovorans]
MRFASHILCAIVSTLAALTISVRAAAARQPNIIVILSDDQGYGDVGFNGCGDIPTPALDSIAANGVRFTDGYVTAPQCGPSRAGLISGRYQNEFGREQNQYLDAFGMPDGVRFFSEYMKELGYATGAVGKWHLSAEPLRSERTDTPNERGFDYFYGHLTGGTLYLPHGERESIPYLWRNDEPVKETRYLTHVFGDEASAFIDRNADRPFFLYLAFNAPHTPLQAPKDYLERFAHLASPDDEPVHCGYTDRMIEHPRQVYAAMVAAMDDAVGGVLATLRRNGLEEDTLVFFLSDNGGPTGSTRANNEPLRGVKGDTLEGGIRVPFALQWPGTVPAGQVVETPVISLDLLPTALAAAGAQDAVAPELDGRNLLPLVTGAEQWEPRTLHWRFPHPPARPEYHVWAIRRGEWKITKEWLRGSARHGDNHARTGLYRLDRDIDESEDLKDANPERYAELLQTYERWDATLPPRLTMTKKETLMFGREHPELRDAVTPWE